MSIHTEQDKSNPNNEIYFKFALKKILILLGSFNKNIWKIEFIENFFLDKLSQIFSLLLMIHLHCRKKQINITQIKF